MPPRKPTTDLDRSVAVSLDASAQLMPYVPRLLEGVEALGSSPRRVVNWLREAGIGPGHLVHDLGCGKGAVAVAIARRLGCRVRGVDGLAAFVDAAWAMAEQYNVEQICRFTCGDVARAARPAGDAVIMLGVLPIGRALPILRAAVKRGGVYIVDDAVALEGTRPARQLTGGSRPTRRGVRTLIEERGDTILREHIMSPSEYRTHERRIYTSIAESARTLIQDRPDLSRDVHDFLASQRRAGASLWRGPWRGAAWMVRRDGVGNA